MPNEEGNIMIWGVKTDFYILREKKMETKTFNELICDTSFRPPYAQKEEKQKRQTNY